MLPPETFRQKMNKEAVAIGGVLHDSSGFFFTDKNGVISHFETLKDFQLFAAQIKSETPKQTEPVKL